METGKLLDCAVRGHFSLPPKANSRQVRRNIHVDTTSNSRSPPSPSSALLSPRGEIYCVVGVAERDKIVSTHLSDMFRRGGTAYRNQEGRAAPSLSITPVSLTPG
uniref:Uncharacterized protein n=1 Tax=Branchiostoma floridae TaxID=7739 RepID=C3Y7K9_BRAFL|eukprot:XP_002607827.1 hypothetical protein BRAFLDRAFT_64090 [Branchiostoma floridae]